MAGHSRFLLLLALIVGVTGLTLGPSWTARDSTRFPSQPITLVVPLPPGGVSQRLADVLAPALSRSLGAPVNVYSIAGESGARGARYVAQATPDGHTLLVTPSTLLLLDPAIVTNAGFSPQRDLDPLIMAVRSPLVLVVRSELAVTSLAEFAAYLRTQPDTSFGASGRGSINDLVAGEFLRTIGANGRLAYFQGGGAVVPALLAGDIQASFQAPSLVADAVARGEVRALAVTGSVPSPLLPNVPTFAESGMPQMDAYTWQAVAAPAGLPPSVRDALELALRIALLEHGVMGQLQTNGLEVVASGSRQISRVLATERRRWLEIMTSDGSLRPSR
ncbi:lipoprotein [Azorhizobium oxalatiphilum]|uniref:Lipoprotein n=1 Tax=Azorhizobium oxalatiphilum TaxID=980631 RepID=A0A917C9C4_9HYPH|nr:tripartite tricarboxylate transporter substrate binding protein [Azorhizobium oxalatiphilum]GGF77059.1 lipoprotein [Azorhizobium oxalatiphilum]